MENTYIGALLLTSVIMSQADECIVGVIGENVQLPCIYNGSKNLASLVLSSEWKRDLEVIHTANWTKQQEDRQNMSRSTTVSSSAPNSGDFTMVVRDIRLSDARHSRFHLKLQGQENSILVCTICLNVSDHLSHTTLLRENIVNREKTPLVCNTRGGFPAPNIYWIINHTQRPPKTPNITYVNTLPKSQLYNITSVLSINISPDTVVACVIEHYVLNETWTTTNYGVKSNVEDGCLSKYLWMFSTVLCVVVFLLVAASLCYQRKLDRDIKRRKHFSYGDYSRSELIVMDMKLWASLPETDV